MSTQRRRRPGVPKNNATRSGVLTPAPKKNMQSVSTKQARKPVNEIPEEVEPENLLAKIPRRLKTKNVKGKDTQFTVQYEIEPTVKKYPKTVDKNVEASARDIEMSTFKRNVLKTFTDKMQEAAGA